MAAFALVPQLIGDNAQVGHFAREKFLCLRLLSVSLARAELFF